MGVSVLVVPSLGIAYVLSPPDFGFIPFILPCLTDLGSVLQRLTWDEALDLNLFCAVVCRFLLPPFPIHPQGLGGGRILPATS